MECAFIIRRMAQLALNLLGPLHITRDGATVVFRSDKERALLAFLVVEADRPHRREALTGLLYPDQAQTQAQSNLRKTLFRLRAALGESAKSSAGLLLITPKTVQFNPASPHTLDVQEFRARVERTRQHKHRRAETCARCAQELEHAAGIYRGEFLAGFTHSGSDLFEEWAVITRERLHQQALDALEQLVAFFLHRREWDALITHARRLLELEPWRESAHRALMQAFVAQSQRAAAFGQYEQCKNILAEHFDAEPERETRALYASIRSGTFTPPQTQVSGLKSPLTPLIGRAREIEILTARLLDPTQRLHTIVAPGGMGKTRLALAAAERVQHDFQDGAFFVPLAGIDGNLSNLNDSIATAVADVLGITFSGSVTPARQLQTFLRSKELLLILDNLEQLMPSAVWLVELVASAPQSTILVTSREALNVRAESIFRLDGLSVPPQDDEVTLRASEGVQLFVERAARAAGQFTVTPESLTAVSAICRRVEGLPLAIELAAAWTRTRTLKEILAALDENLDLLATTQRDVPARHSSLRAVWQGSWDLLRPREQQVLAQTSIFRGGFDHNAAEVIIKAQQRDLDILIDKSLLKRTEQGRYEIHELLRYFSSEKFDRLNNVQKDYSAYYLHFSAQRGAKLQNSEPKTILTEIWRELDNLRVAWQNAVENEWFELLDSNIVEGVTTFYYLTGLFREGLALAENALTHAERVAARSPELVLHLQLARATFLERLARYDEALLALDALMQALTPGDLLYARAQLRVGWVCYWTGKLEQGRAVLRETFEWARAHHETALEADTQYVAGLIEQSASDIENARAFYERALELYRVDHNRYGESSALVNLADIGVDNTIFDDALRYAQDALALSTQIGKRFDQAAANVILGSIYYELGNYSRATPYYREAHRLFREMGNGSGESIALRDLAVLALHRGAIEEGFAYAREAARVAREVGSTYREGMTQCVIGDLYLARRDLEHAEQAYTSAVEFLQRAERGHRALDARAGLARVALLQGDAELAQQRVHELVTLPAQNFDESADATAVFLTCYQILAAHDSARAREILQRGMDDLTLRAARIRDDAVRHEFLENNPAARAMRREYERALGKDR